MEAPLHEMGARELAVRIGAGALRATEVARHFIDRVERLNPALNAIVQFDARQVLDDAAAVERRHASGETLPMAGVPFTVKDNLWVEGRHIAQGSRLFEDFIAPRDAWAVARLRARGAVVLGITNCSEFACKGVTSNLLYGATRHPIDPTLTPGGSSGGAVSALAAGLGLLALGTDAGGSTRRPAAHCGLVGFKPSPGLIPHPWGFAEPNYGLSVIGVMARSVADGAWLYDQLLAYDAGDPAGVPIGVGLDASPSLDAPLPEGLRVAWSPQLGCDFAIDADVLAALQSRIDALRAAGWRIADADPPWPREAREYPLLALQQAGLHALYGHRLAEERERIDPVLVQQIEAGARVTSADVARALRLRQRIGASLARFFESFDVLLCPTAPVTAWPLALLGPPTIGGKPAGPRGHAAFTPLFNYCGVPACSVPAGEVRGLPVGLQVVAPCYEDARVLQCARRIETLL
ncbi:MULTISPECIES: amidase [unclassified Variovorax]|uniref:amidase n=1 Tax=unclassified Variovorax TaxID=663243 RepID=UPI00257735F6|nr:MULTISPECIES: amidase [unclassified Variovorax]MDM0090496.1 amidase [Variovorax sp. J22G40]MDM0147839.1 amidase [Variovorax sp. J2P1-31]